MKYLLMMVLLVFVTNQLMLGQTADSIKTKSEKKEVKEQVKSTAVKKESEKQQKQDQKVEDKKLEGFIDLNGNGIDDRLEQGKKGKGKGKNKRVQKDRFIDADGDGICDGKESAIGLRKMYQSRKGHGGKK